jgi:hypothetical protein
LQKSVWLVRQECGAGSGGVIHILKVAAICPVDKNYVRWMGVLHAFVDESKEKGYLMVAVVCDDSQLKTIRQKMHSLRLPGQRRIHMRKESSSRQRLIVSEVRKFEMQKVVVRSNARYKQDARSECLSLLVTKCANLGVRSLTIEIDQSEYQRDLQTLSNAEGIADLSIKFSQPSEEPALWLADVTVWIESHKRT